MHLSYKEKAFEIDLKKKKKLRKFELFFGD